ncbi:hypothetical protein Bp8pS_007 [Bacillus phage vB_BpuM-BpSp]|nr:hypothetical protein Bp8pS_007 [Bacillus phage vB_BpuM-BpSp]
MKKFEIGHRFINDLGETISTNQEYISSFINNRFEDLYEMRKEDIKRSLVTDIDIDLSDLINQLSNAFLNISDKYYRHANNNLPLAVVHFFKKFIENNIFNFFSLENKKNIVQTKLPTWSEGFTIVINVKNINEKEVMNTFKHDTNKRIESYLIKKLLENKNMMVFDEVRGGFTIDQTEYDSNFKFVCNQIIKELDDNDYFYTLKRDYLVDLKNR